MDAKRRTSKEIESSMDLEYNSIADVSVVPAFPLFEPALPGSPVRKAKFLSEAATQFAELKARAVRVREALAASLPQPPLVPQDFVGRKREVAEEAARDFEPTSRDIMAAISTLSSSMVFREEMRADITEAIELLKHKQASMDSNLVTVQQHIANLNTRLVAVEGETVKKPKSSRSN